MEPDHRDNKDTLVETRTNRREYGKKVGQEEELQQHVATFDHTELH